MPVGAYYIKVNFGCPLLSVDVSEVAGFFSNGHKLLCGIVVFTKADSDGKFLYV